MVFEVGGDRVDPTREEFRARLESPEVATEPFALSGSVAVGFDPVQDGSVAIRAHRDASDVPFYRLTPVALGPSRWLRVEVPVDVRRLRGCEQLIAVLSAAAPASMTVFAVLRLKTPGGRHVDAGSMEMEIGRPRKNYTFPINLDDLPAAELARAESARVCFIIEARDADLDYFGLRMFGVERMIGGSDAPAVDRIREAASADSPDVLSRRLDTSALRRPITRMSSLREFGTSVFVDADHANGAPRCRRSVGGVVFDFEPARKCRWRSFEFRFAEVASSEALSAMVALEGRATGSTPWVSAPIRVRVYGSDGTWEDSPSIGALEILRERGRHTAVVDIAPVLPDDRDVHTLGVMVFIPEACRTLHVNDFGTYLYDRATASSVSEAR